MSHIQQEEVYIHMLEIEAKQQINETRDQNPFRFILQIESSHYTKEKHDSISMSLHPYIANWNRIGKRKPQEMHNKIIKSSER